MKRTSSALLILSLLAGVLVTSTSLRGEDFSFREDPVIVVAKIRNNLPGGLATAHYGQQTYQKPIQSTEAITSAFISRLGEAGHFRIIERDLLPDLRVEMFNSEEDLAATIVKYPGIFKADYAFICELSTLDLNTSLTIVYGVETEQTMVTAHFDMRIVDLNPHKYWQIVDAKEDSIVEGRFETEEEVNETLQELKEAYPEVEFTVVPPPETLPGEHVWAAHGSISKVVFQLTGFGNYYATNKDLLSEDLILNTMMLGTEELIIRVMDTRWPLRVSHVDDQQRIYLNRGNWLVERAGERAGIPGIKVGKIGSRTYLEPPSFFVIREPGVVIRNPDNGEVQGSTRGKELAKLRVDRSNVQLKQSIATLVDGSATQDLLQGVCEPLTMDAFKLEGKKLTAKKSILRLYLQWKYQLKLPMGHFNDLPNKWSNPDATITKKKQFRVPKK
ncbi:MAG: CsgG/HfaB family protein [Pirellulaceae bacterium]